MRNGAFAVWTVFIGLLVLSGVSKAAPEEATSSSRNLPLMMTTTPSTDPLTTEKVWVLDPEELNPHRQRWLVSRKVELAGLAPREIKQPNGTLIFGLMAEGIRSVTTTYVRPAGPWYREFKDFPCGSEPISWFATREGSEKAAAVGASQWDHTLAEDQLQLSLALSRITGSSPGIALRKGETLFQNWLTEVTAHWRRDGRPAAKRAEWAYYEKLAKENKACRKTRGSSTSHAVVPWELMMELPAEGDAGRAGTPVDEMKLIARAPVKLWDGLFSIRLNVTIAGRKLSGRFLVDSGVGTSVLSPEWLEGQGILPAWIEVPGASPKRVPWGGTPGSGQGGLAPTALVDSVEIGNTKIDLQEFAIFDTEFFAPPDSASSCCDGVLGTDFLRKYVVEMQPGPPAELKVWPAENFHLAPNIHAQWLEVGLTPNGDPISTCQTQPVKASEPRFVGVRWDTGREDALDVHLPWQKEARSHSYEPWGNQWRLSCGPQPSEPIAIRIPVTFPKLDPYENNAITSKVPAVSVGMALLGRGSVYFDLPHGRIWVPAQSSDAPLRENRSGLKVKFEFLKGRLDRRVLKVTELRAKSPAQALFARGLRTGMQIARIDGQDASSFDLWEIEQRLAGAQGGDVVRVQFQGPRGLVMGELKLNTKK